MVEEQRHLLLGNESLQLAHFVGNMNMMAPEESNRLFRSCQLFQHRSQRAETPSKELSIIGGGPFGTVHQPMLIEEINMVAIKEVRYVNSKQWERMMKRRIKRQVEKIKKMTNDKAELQTSVPSQSQKKYKYQSRHLHAEKRIRNEKGRFVGTRPKLPEGQVVGKKKRGRKSKKELLEIKQREQQERLARQEAEYAAKMKLTSPQHFQKPTDLSNTGGSPNQNPLSSMASMEQ